MRDGHKRLINEIEAMLQSREFDALHKRKREELRQLADAVRQEINKDKPETAKVRSRGETLLAKTTEFGLTVCAHAMGAALAVFAIGE